MDPTALKSIRQFTKESTLPIDGIASSVAPAWFYK
jgi:hypothetical protein